MKEPLKTVPNVGDKVTLDGTYASYTQSPLMITMSDGKRGGAEEGSGEASCAPHNARITRVGEAQFKTQTGWPPSGGHLFLGLEGRGTPSPPPVFAQSLERIGVKGGLYVCGGVLLCKV